MSGMVDRFGKDIAATRAPDVEQSTEGTRDEGKWARVRATVMESPAFYAWLAQFGTRVRIEKPRELAQGYQHHLESILEAY